MSNTATESPPITMLFIDLALGARFRYIGQARIWIKLNDEDYGMIAEYNPEFMCHPRWTGQSICSAVDTFEQMKTLMVEFVN